MKSFSKTRCPDHGYNIASISIHKWPSDVILEMTTFTVKSCQKSWQSPAGWHFLQQIFGHGVKLLSSRMISHCLFNELSKMSSLWVTRHLSEQTMVSTMVSSSPEVNHFYSSHSLPTRAAPMTQCPGLTCWASINQSGPGHGWQSSPEPSEDHSPALSKHRDHINTYTNTMGVKIGDFDLDTTNISPADVENLRRMLPEDLQQPGKLSQLEIIIEAIHYIQMLQTKLKAEMKEGMK